MIAIAKESSIDSRIANKYCFSTYGEAVKLIEKNNFRYLRERPVEYEQNEYGEVDVRLTLTKVSRNFYSFIRQVGDELYFQGTLKPDPVVSDSRLSSLLAAGFRKL